MSQEYKHQSVLLQESVDALITDPSGFYVDGTFGRGGHSRLILERLSPAGRLLVMDKDPEAIGVAQTLRSEDARVHIWHGSFGSLREAVAGQAQGSVQGVLLDLGVSSPQLDDPLRGFSFSWDGPLDMRMDNSRGMTAAEWLQQAQEAEIARVFYEYGEEKFGRRMAKAVVAARTKQPITRTLQLAEIIKEANPAWERHKHPATRAFQAIRIFINNELQDLEAVLPAMLYVLNKGGRMVVISFHSLEDRLVKRFIRDQERGDDFPRDLPVTADKLNPRLRSLGKPVKGADEEKTENVRARSAVMRVAEKTA
ncbi:MAG: 16S rRNA (cytosine(1402)-N(4))-methyltransferase RsmH [Gammaproteobacteria bacterium]